MENTKRMVLVDEKMLDVTSALQAKQDMSWNKPSDQTVKSNINKQMKSTLDDQSIPEDVKAKQYRQQLNRFLQTKRKLPTVNEFRTKRKLPTVNDSLDVKRPTVDELLDVKRPKRDSASLAIKPGKRKSVVVLKRVSKRIKKKPQRYADIEWENW
jgi:hypothetical protein